MDIVNGEAVRNELNKESNGGSELMAQRFLNTVDKELLKDFHIVVSRLREPLREDKIRVLWLHDLPNDSESVHLANGGWKKFHKIVFVSYWQRDAYINTFGIPWEMCTVIHNGIYPIDVDIDQKFDYKEGDPINLVYFTTPHRGLNILIPVVKKIIEDDSSVHLDVYSSFEIYGWKQRDKDYEPLFDEIKKSKNMTYHGAVTNDEIRDKLKHTQIFAYPSIWAETSCLSLMEAMSSGNLCVHPNYAALTETSGSLTQMYDLQGDLNAHASIFYNNLMAAITAIKNGMVVNSVKSAKSYTDIVYSWELQSIKWNSLLKSLQQGVVDRKMEQPVLEEFANYGS